MVPSLSPHIDQLLRAGTVIPALPLALTEDRRLDKRRQRALCRYYMAAGAGGLAVGVHSTQFAIRNPKVGLFKPVLELAIEELTKDQGTPRIKIAGICGPLEQAAREAELAASLGYDLGLLSMGGLQGLSEDELLERAARVGEIIPLFGFYLQPSVGGRVLSYQFWERFVEIHHVKAIKLAPFNRYQTLDVVRAVCNSTRCADISLYTGNDDNIVSDLLTPYRFFVNDRLVEKWFVGGLLGHWAVWTSKAVQLLGEIKKARRNGSIPLQLLHKGIEITDMNSVVFDAANGFKGCIPGIHEVLRRQGLLAGILCLDPEESLSPGQAEEIERVSKAYVDLTDDRFVQDNLANWLTDN